jgi:hypothetical protein
VCSGGRCGPASGWEGRGGSGAAIPGENGRKGGGWLLEAPLTMEWVATVEAVEAPAVRGRGAAHRRQNDGLSFGLRRRAQTWLASTTAGVGAASAGRRCG